jgi:hypothetical protein
MKYKRSSLHVLSVELNLAIAYNYRLTNLCGKMVEWEFLLVF